MIGYDFDFFWSAARAFLDGQSPYTVEGFFSPFPFVLAMIPFGLLPFYPAYALWSVISLFSLGYIARRKLLQLVFYLPVFYTFWVGQVDLIILALGLSASWLGVALSTLKPQLAVFILPYSIYRWWQEDNKDRIWKMGIAVVVIYGVPTLIAPDWWLSWMNATPGILVYSLHASSLFGLSALVNIATSIMFVILSVIAGIVFVLIRPLKENDYWSWVALFNPISNIYSLCVLNRFVDWIAILLSWALMPLTIGLHSGLPWVALPLYILWRDHRKKPALSTQPG